MTLAPDAGAALSPPGLDKGCLSVMIPHPAVDVYGQPLLRLRTSYFGSGVVRYADLEWYFPDNKLFCIFDCIRYKSYFEHQIKPYFVKHNVSLNDITPQDIQSYYNSKIQKPGEHIKGKLSGKSLRDHHCVIRGALLEAERKNIIPYNPAERVTLPKKGKFKGHYYTQEQVLKLLDAIDGTVIENIVVFTVFYSLRRSEAVGLKWENIDLDNDTFTIQSTVVRFSKVIEKNTTKNDESNSTYPIVPEIRDLLDKVKAKQERMKQEFGDSYIDSGYVFTWPDGRMLNPDYVTRKFSKILKANNLPHIRFHDLRHTTASLLIAKGYDLKRVQEWLRHKEIGTTMNIYGHLAFDDKKYTADAMTNILAQQKEE